MGMLIFLGIVIGVNFAGNYYIFHRLAYFFGFKKNLWFYLFISLLSASYVVTTIAEAHYPNLLTRSLNVISANWLGMALVLISVLVIYEIVRLAGVRPEARTAGFAVMGVTAAIWGYAFFNASRIVITEVEIPAPVELKIAHLSDIHYGSNRGKFLERIVAKTNALEPDIVVITGDLIDFHGEVVLPLDALNGFSAPTYFVTGNHEIYYGRDRVLELLEPLDMVVLQNQSVNNHGIQIIGVAFEVMPDMLGSMLERIGVDDELFSILLYHQPKGLEEAAEAGVDLKLSGHTHDGQIVPFNLAVNKVYKKTKGLYEHNGSYLYVSTGTGAWGPRMRLGSNNEIVLIHLSSDRN